MVFRLSLFFLISFCGIEVFSQGANSNNFEVISRVYFGSTPFDANDIMNPPVGTNTLPCTGYSDFSLGNTNNGDGNITGAEYLTGVVRNGTYNLEIEGGFCGSIPNVSNANRSMKVYIDYDASGSFEPVELVYTSPYYDNNFPIASTTVTIPNTASFGQIKMRIVYNRVGPFTALWEINAINWATNNYQYGEAEDYSLIVVGYMDSVQSSNPTCFSSSDGQIQIFPNLAAPTTTEFSINGLAGPWSTDLIYTDLAPGNYDIWARDAAMAPDYVYEQLQTSIAAADTFAVSPQIVSDYNGSNISCHNSSDGEINLTVTGADPSLFTYQYSSLTNPVLINTPNPIVGLEANTYTIIAIDPQGCVSLPEEIEIVAPQELEIDIISIVQPPTCNSGCDAILNIQASGGTSPYIYTVDGNNNGNNNIISNVCFGNPLVTLEDENGCSVQLNGAVPNPLDLTLTANIASDYTTFAVSCQNASDGIIQVNTTGGSEGEYLYSINGGLTFPYSSSTTLDINSLGQGIYSVVAMDSNMCESSTIDLVLNAPPAVSFDFITTTSPISCNGFNDGVISAQGINGVGGYEYSIDGGLTMQGSGVFSNLSADDYEITIFDDNNCIFSETYSLTQPQEVNIVSTTITSNYNGSEVSCFGASDAVLNINASGGTIPYSYSLVPNPTILPVPVNNLITNLPAGIQTIQIFDANNCESTPQPFEIIQPDELIISSVSPVSNVSCYGGSDGEITINASGGTGSYSYFVDALYNSINQAPFLINGLAANIYNIVVTDANGCSTPSLAQEITQPNQLETNLSVVNLGCDGDFGSASVSPVGGTPNYIISWSNGETGISVDQLNSGAYSVTIIDQLNCQEVTDFQITEPTITTTINPILCNGSGNGEITATINNSNPASIFSILWDDVNNQTTNTATGLPAGDYTVTMTDQFGCVLVASASLPEPDSLNVFVEHTQLCPNNPTATALVFASGGLNPYSYQWSNNETSTLIYLQNPGSYSVQVTDLNNCQQDFAFSIDPISPIQLDFITQGVSCKDNNDGSLEAIPSGGYEPYTFIWSNYITTALNQNIQSGIYSVTITDNNGCQYFKDVELPSNDQSCITAYSAFSPNGDQNNDYWHIDNIELYPDALVEVFNRWGDRVYSSKKYINAWLGAWQGVYENNPLPSATYYYVITLNNDEEPIVGTVTIVR